MARCKQAFTLVELLVVITIITIMAALLMPAMLQARDSARTATCMSNQKQLALAEIMYSEDYGGYDTYRWAPGSQAEWDRNTWWMRALRGKYGGASYLPALPWSKCYDSDFYKYTGVLLCQTMYATGASAGSYGINACERNSNCLFQGRVKLAKLPKPTTKIWFICNGRAGILTGTTWGYCCAKSYSHHSMKSGTNLLYFDSHVKFLNAYDFLYNTYSEGWVDLQKYGVDDK